MKQSLKDRLLDYLRRHSPEWFASGELQRMVANKTTYTPRTVVRRLEELKESGVLEVEYRAKRHAWYRYKGIILPKRPEPAAQTKDLFKKETEEKHE